VAIRVLTERERDELRRDRGPAEPRPTAAGAQQSLQRPALRPGRRGRLWRRAFGR
jgi:hypothetical protein